MKEKPESLETKVKQALKSVYDPELPVNICDLGLIYSVDEQRAGKVLVRMTLTTPNCPVADSLPQQVKMTAELVPGVTVAEIELVWDPPWSRDMMTDEGKMLMNLLGF